MYKWVIVEMNQNPFDGDTLREDSAAFYMWGLQIEGHCITTSAGLPRKTLEPLLSYFGVPTMESLVGQSFESERNEASEALDLLLTTIRNGGSYTPPPYYLVRQHVIQALALGREPDLSAIDHQTIANSFAEVWDFYRANKKWLRRTKAQIKSLSSGHVILRQGRRKDFPERINGPVEYLQLLTDDKIFKVIIGPYSTPVRFV